MPMKLCVLPSLVAGEVKPFLNMLGFSEVSIQAATSSDINFDGFQADFKQPALILHSRPERVIARAIHAGQSPQAAVAAWLSSMTSLLESTRALRRYCVWVELEAAMLNPAELIKALPEHVQLPKIDAPLSSLPLPELPAMYLLLAVQAVQRHPGCQALLPQLEALTLPLTANWIYCTPELDLDALHGGLVSQQSELTDLKAENDLIIAELHRVQEAFENSQKEQQQVAATLCEKEQAIAEQCKRLDELSSTADKKAKNEQQLQADLTDLKAENDLIIAELHRVQEAFEQILIEQKTTGKHLHDLQVEKDVALTDNKKLEQYISRLSARNIFRFAVSLGLLPAKDASARSMKKRINKEMELIKESGYFDAKWYLSRYPDVKAKGVDPLRHYVRFGGLEGRHPSSRFDSAWYLFKHKDVKIDGQNPLVHFLLFGQKENRQVKTVEEHSESKNA